MAPSKAPTSWDDEESESTPPSSPPAAPVIARRSKFDDEEDDSDVLDSWDAAEDSEVEREKAKKAAEAKAKAEEDAKKNHKSKSQRIEERRQENMRRRQTEEGETTDEDEDEADKRARLRASEKESDLKHAEDLFSDIGISNNRSASKPVTIQEGDDPNQAVNLSTLNIFNPKTAPEFRQLRETLVPLLTANAKKPQYALFMPDFTKELSRDLSSDQIKKIASALSTLSNEKLKEEKAADKSNKKTKATKTKNALVADRPSSRVDTTAYDDDGLDDGDFM